MNPYQSCPWCETQHADWGFPEGSAEVGAWVLCMKCGRWLVIDEQLKLRRATADERKLIRQNALAMNLRAVFRKAVEQHRRPSESG